MIFVLSNLFPVFNLTPLILSFTLAVSQRREYMSSRQTSSVESEPLPVTKRTKLEDLPGLDPDAIKALHAAGIDNVGQLQKTYLDIAVVIHQAMRTRPRSASKAVHIILQYKSTALTRSSPVSSRRPLVPSVSI